MSLTHRICRFALAAAFPAAFLAACSEPAQQQAEQPSSSTAAAADTQKSAASSAASSAANAPIADAKQPAKATETPAPAAKTQPSTTPTLPASKPATQPAEQKAPAVAEETFNLVRAVQMDERTISTFNNDVEDFEIETGALQTWSAANLREYFGTYYGPLGSEVASIKITNAGSGKLTLTIGYQAEVATEDGMINQQEGERVAAGIQPVGTTLQWKRMNPVYVTQGQFVKWMVAGAPQYGILVYGTAPGKAPYTLMHKVKSN